MKEARSTVQSGKDQRILILASLGGDGRALSDAAAAAGERAEEVAPDGLRAALDDGVGAVFLTEEALTARTLETIGGWAAGTPYWSALPVLVLLRDSVNLSRDLREFLEADFQPSLSMTILNRPCDPIILKKSIQEAMRNRRRQYLVRDQIEALETSRRQIEILAREVQHRAKNNLARIAAVVRQTQRGTADVDAFADSVAARIGAMSRGQDLLDFGVRDGTTLAELVEAEVSAVTDAWRDRLHLDGADVPLSSSAGLALHLVFHELATNAAKYGALSVDDGVINVRCAMRDLSGGEELEVIWEETGGPVVSPPARRGFGSRLIERVLQDELHGTAELDYASAGVRCRMVMPLDSTSRN